RGAVRAQVIALPDADQTPEDFVLARRLAENSCLVLAPVLISRESTFSGNPAVRMTRQPHREFIYRMAYEMGRHVIGYEIQKALAAVDWFAQRKPPLPIGVAGDGEGGLVALHAAALDERVNAALVTGYSGPGPEVWSEPIYRSVWSQLNGYRRADIEGMIAPRALAGELAPFLRALKVTGALRPAGPEPKFAGVADPVARQRRQFRQMVEFTQSLVRRSGGVRREFWREADTSSVARWEESVEPNRQRLREEVIGRMPAPSEPLAAQSRKAYETAAFTGYELVLPVWPDVFASGILLVPKDLKAGERRPVVVCQHGLEGRPHDLVDPPNERAGRVYQRYAAALAERGFIVYAPQNPYVGGEKFRVLVRKAHPLKLSLFSFIIGQHQRTLEWLATLPFVDASRIGFYGLSYGGKTAMRLPALLKEYALSICSADFNEWIWKITSVDEPFSYMFTNEYDMLEFDLGHTFNYADMAAMIAPRPFMVERGHKDGVGIDEWVAYEYAKVRRFYTFLGIGDRTTIAFFDGPHAIHGAETYDFLHRHLKWRRR
ncbi:MAG: alpha/beta hydrolase family protein, partial [Bryobacteraceae bacterium]